MSNKEKQFNIKLYGILAFVSVAVILVITCTFTFKAKYIAFHPEELAKAYVDTIVQTGDGYNAYKNTLVSKSMKYGDFIRENYINPVVTKDGNDYSSDEYKSEKTLNDDGTLTGQLTEGMYAVYEALVGRYGWDDYDSIFTEYIKTLTAMREEIFGDKFFNDEVFFTAFEANVSAFGKALTGTDETFDENTGVKLSEKTVGEYQKLYGEDYKIVCKAGKAEAGYTDGWLMNADAEALEAYGVEADKISEVATVTVEVSLDGGKKLTQCEVTLVKIGMSWYVDNLSTNTSALYMPLYTAE